MSTPFLQGFSRSIVRRMVEEGTLEISAPEDEVAAYVADQLAGARPNSSLISSLAGALVTCPDVDEVYADDDDLKALLEDLGPVWRTGT